MNKYHSRKITRDGEVFDSIKEYRRYCELKLLEKAGEIYDLERQVKFLLVPAQYESSEAGKKGRRKRGKLAEREISYYADFVYYRGNMLVVEDAKGIRTKEYIIKRKLMRYFLGIKVEEI